MNKTNLGTEIKSILDLNDKKQFLKFLFHNTSKTSWYKFQYITYTNDLKNGKIR